MKNPTLPLLAALLLAPLLARADIVPAPLFQSGAVLQRDVPIPVWGTARPGEAVTVTLGGDSLRTTAGSDGTWRVDLPARAASDAPLTLRLQGDNSLEFTDVVVGEVWLISGQSNAEWVLRDTYDADIEQRTARFPLVREFKVPRTVADAPQRTTKGSWVKASPDTVLMMSAIGYIFARDLHLTLGVPVGILNSTWGGTPIESWMRSEALASDPAFNIVGERWRKVLEEYPKRKADHEQALAAWRSEKAAAEAAGRPFTKQQPRGPSGPGTSDTPSGLYNAMVHPLVPYALRGMLWYQGEANGGRAKEYGALFRTLITDWREVFARPEAPFLFAQLAPFSRASANATNWADLREAQASVLTLPATGMAVLSDVGDVNDIHPREKSKVARRLLRHALALSYGDSKIVTASPSMTAVESIAASDGQPAKMRVRFTPNRRLRFTSLRLEGFEVAGEDKVFHPASAELVDNTVVLSAPNVPAPVAVRYLWRNAAQGTLEDNLGLPVAPFRTDTW